MRDLIRRATSDSKGLPKIVREGRKAAFADEGGGSLFAWPVLGIARKVKGKEKVEDFLYSKYHRPLKNVDEKLGRLLEKELGTKKLFRQVDVIPTTRTMGKGKHPVHINHETHSATAPVTKAAKIVAPIAATLFLSEKLSKHGEDQMLNQEDKSSSELLKEAADALDLEHRRKSATKLAFQMVERGKIPAFASFEELEEKVASLLTKDLRVVQEALEIDVDMPDFGKVASSSDIPTNATAAFFNRLADD